MCSFPVKIRWHACLVMTALILFSTPLTVLAQDDSASEDNIWDMTIDELLEMTVVTAAKAEEGISDAPAVIDVITQSQLSQLGLTNLYEAISFLPGIEMMETYFGRTVLNFRGIQNLHYTNKYLVMINGNPIYETTNGSFLLEMIPLNAIRQIEVIRGPGSPLYGTNAYTGVINILTKSAKSDESVRQVSVGGGSFNTVSAGFSGNLSVHSSTDLFAAAQINYDDGYPFRVKQDEKGNRSELAYENDIIRTFVQLASGPFTLDVGYGYLKKSVYGITPNVDYAGHCKYNSAYSNARFETEITPKNHLQAMLRVHYFAMPLMETQYFPYPGFAGHDTTTTHMETSSILLGSEWQLNSKIRDYLSVVSGLVSEYQYSGDYVLYWDDDQSIHPFSPYTKSFDNLSLAMYAELQYQYRQTFEVVGGVRTIYDRDMNEVFFAPRVGTIFHWQENVHLKALYGTSYRSPVIFEKRVETYNVLFGDDELEAELIETLDLVLESQLNQNNLFRVNGFLETTDKVIMRRTGLTPEEQEMYGEDAAVYINSQSGEKIYGIELCTKGVIPGFGSYGANFSWKDAADTEINTFAHMTGNMWLNWRINDRISLAPQFQYVGEREGYSQRELAFMDYGKYELDPYILLNLNAQITWNQLSLSIQGKNLLDEEYSYPEYIRQLSEEVPGGPERSFMATLSYHFKK